MLWLNNARGTVVEGRAIGGATLTVSAADASRFGAPDGGANLLRLSFFDSEGTPKGILNATGRAGTILSIAVPEGSTDFAVAAGWTVANVPTAQDLLELQAVTSTILQLSNGPTILFSDDSGTVGDPKYIDVNIPAIFPPQSGKAGQALTTDGERLGWAPFASTEDIAGKQDALPTDGVSGEFLAADGSWKTPPAPDLSGYASVADLEALEPTIDAGTTSQYWRGDKTWRATSDITDGFATTTTTTALDGRLTTLEGAPKPLILLASWSMPTPTAGVVCAERPGVPVDFEAAFVTANAAVNPVGGGFSFNIACNAVNLWESPNSYAADKTDMLTISMFDAGELEAGGLFELTLSSLGTGVESVVVQLWGREVTA